MDYSPPGSSVHGTSKARILEWVTIFFSRGSCRSWDQTRVSCLAGRFFTTEQPGKSQLWHSVSSIAQSCLTLRPHESQHTRPPCPSPTPGVYPNLCPLSWWCHPAISSSVVPFSSCPQSLLASGSFPMSQLFTWGGQSIWVLASGSVLPMNTTLAVTKNITWNILFSS